MLNYLLSKGYYNFNTQLSTYVRRGKHRPKTPIQIGSLTHNFKLQSQQLYTDFDITHRYFQNCQNLTQFHQLQCSQQTNTLSMIFKISNGNERVNKCLPLQNSINYALEKMLNGGSRRYPIRNLVQAAKQKSFNNVEYMSTINEDYLMFNFNTPILKDYSHLLKVYHDMLFNPLLRKEDFEELVWRYSFDRSRKLQLKGELAEELKETDYYEENFIYKQIIKHFFSKKISTICQQQELINITYQKLVAFYNEAISPQNLILINHGDMSAQFILNLWKEISQQKKVQQRAQNQITGTIKKQQSTPKSNAQGFQSQSLPKTIVFQHMKPQTILMLSFKIGSANEQQKVLLSILSYILFDMPQSPFMKFNTPQTPYPINYGYKNRYFNVGITFNDLAASQQKLNQAQKQKIMKQKQKAIMQTLHGLVSKRIDNSLIEKCLSHLQSNYYTSNGLKIIESIADRLISGQNLSCLSVTAMIQKLFKKYRKQNIFQKLISKFLIENQQYLIFRGYNNYQMIQNKQFQRRKFYSEIKKKIHEEQLRKILTYQPPNVLQDFKVLPQILPAQLEWFQDAEPTVTKVQGVKIFYQNRLNGVKITLKSDISDLDEQLYPFLELFCKTYSKMGSKFMKEDAYQQILNRYVNNIDVRYQTQKSIQDPNQMKVYLFFTIDFNDRYFEYGFSLINGLVNGYNFDNIFALSKSIQKSASECFHFISQDIVSFHGKHIAASKSPFAYFESPIFNTRSITGMAGDLKKVSNPKQILYGISHQLKQIWSKLFYKHRLQVLFECKQSKKDFYFKYLALTLNQINVSKNKNQIIQGISVQNFPQERWLKYFPNFQQELIFQCFKFPYYEKKSAAGLIFSSLVNRNIRQYNKVGGAFLWKGAMISYIEGGRKKVLELEDYYRRIDELDEAKRAIFKRFGRYTARHYFQTGITIEEARFFKQAIIATQKNQVQQILNEFILEALKKGQSSILSLGPRLQNYEPLLKKGWQIQRSVDDLSLQVESYNSMEPHLRLQDYTKVC